MVTGSFLGAWKLLLLCGCTVIHVLPTVANDVNRVVNMDIDRSNIYRRLLLKEEQEHRDNIQKAIADAIQPSPRFSKTMGSLGIARDDKHCLQKILFNERGEQQIWFIPKVVLDYCRIARVYAFTDVHGEIDGMTNLLIANGLFVQSENDGGELLPSNKIINSIIIFCGDAIDRGPHSIRTLRFMKMLHDKINSHNSEWPNAAFMYIMGNHEEFFLHLDVDRRRSPNMRLSMRKWFKVNGAQSTLEEFDKIKITVPGFADKVALSDERAAAHYFSMNHEMGRFLRSTLSLGVVIGDTLYSHAGYTAPFWQKMRKHVGGEFGPKKEQQKRKPAYQIFNEMNADWREYLLGKHNKFVWGHMVTRAALWSADGPSWTRTYDYSDSVADLTDKNLAAFEAFLQVFNDIDQGVEVTKMFVGHNHDAQKIEFIERNGHRLIKGDFDLYLVKNLAALRKLDVGYLYMYVTNRKGQRIYPLEGTVWDVNEAWQTQTAEEWVA